jgi:uncharacterized protein (DUF433 family)
MKLGLFTADQVCTLCRISSRQLSRWNATGFFKPRYAENEKRPFNRIYSFRDVVGLRTIGMLRNKYEVPLKELRRIGDELKQTPESDWSKLVFYLDPTNHIYFEHPATGELMSPQPMGQKPLFQMSKVIRNVERELARMNRRKPRQIGKIDQNRYVARNEPVIAGTRIPTGAIYRLHQAGYSPQDIVREYPRLKPADVRAAIEHEQRIAS